MTDRGEEPVDGFEFFKDPALIEHLSHLTRARVYREAVREPVSAKELAERYEQPLARISYHVKALADAGLLRTVRQTQRRGAIETHYRAVATIDISDEGLAALPPEVRQTLFSVPIKEVAEDALHALDQGVHDDEDLFISRAHFVLTERGRERLYEEVRSFYERLVEVARELAEEAASTDAPTNEMNVVLMNYRGERRAGRNSPYIVSVDREGRPLLDPIPDE